MHLMRNAMRMAMAVAVLATGPAMAQEIKVGGIFDLELRSLRLKTQCLVASGIGKRPDRDDRKWVLGAVMEDHFEVASGIHARLRGAITDFNFGAVSVIPMAGGTPLVQPALVDQGEAWAAGLDATLLPILGPFLVILHRPGKRTE